MFVGYCASWHLGEGQVQLGLGTNDVFLFPLFLMGKIDSVNDQLNGKDCGC